MCVTNGMRPTPGNREFALGLWKMRKTSSISMHSAAKGRNQSTNNQASSSKQGTKTQSQQSTKTRTPTWRFLFGAFGFVVLGLFGFWCLVLGAWILAEAVILRDCDTETQTARRGRNGIIPSAAEKPQPKDQAPSIKPQTRLQERKLPQTQSPASNSGVPVSCIGVCCLGIVWALVLGSWCFRPRQAMDFRDLGGLRRFLAIVVQV